MDVHTHIIDAVQSSSETARPSRPVSTKASPRKVPSKLHLSKLRSARSSAEELSISSDSEQEHGGYQTELTSLPSESNPAEDMQPDDVEDFRDREYPQLKGKTYLDHGGTTLYARSLIEEFSQDLIENLYGNPHSASSPSAIAGHRVDAVRERAIRFFNADPDEYDLVFVSNATAAIKLVIDCFKDYAAATNTPVWYGYHRDAHTSLVGVREATKMHRCFTTDEEVDLWINSGGFGGPRARQLGLFAYPGQSNMTGRRLPQSWAGRIRKSFHKAATYTLLDAAALASTAPLDLSDPATAPDFVALSFYKIFGFPNIGALLVRKDSAHVLASRKYFGGGTVDMIIAIQDTWHAKKETSIHDRLEDGTLPFHSIFALDHAMNVHERLYGPNPMKFISHHTAQLGRMMYDGLTGMKHSNGTPLCIIYKDEAAIYGDPMLQGATIAFNMIRADGSLIGYEEVEEAADERNIFVRSGSLCNPGGVATYLNWSPAEMRAAYAAGHRCTNPTQIVMGRPTGVVRCSLGAMSTASDVRVLLRFLEEVYIDSDGDTSRAAVTHAVEMARTTQSHASQPPAIKTTTLSSPMPNTSGGAENSPWGQPDSGISLEPERPRFVPADYIKYRKPWEDEMRKTQVNNVGMEIKVKELDNGSVQKYGTPSVKARKFGRSVVNLLRTKHSQEGTSRPPLPNSPLPPPSEGMPPHSHDHEQQKHSDRAQYRANVNALGV